MTTRFTPRCPTDNLGGIDRRYSCGRLAPTPEHADVAYMAPEGNLAIVAFDRDGDPGHDWVGKRIQRVLGLDPRDETKVLVETR